jgi:hypothetical protein
MLKYRLHHTTRMNAICTDLSSQVYQPGKCPCTVNASRSPAHKANGIHQAKADNSKATHDNPRRSRDLHTNRKTQLAANVHKKYEPLYRSVWILPIVGRSAKNADKAKQPNPKACNVQKPGNLGVSGDLNSALKPGNSPRNNLGLQIDGYVSYASDAIMRDMSMLIPRFIMQSRRVTMALIALTISCSIPAPATRASDPAAKLGMWEGRWTYDERDYETPYSHAHTSNGTSVCNWAPNRGFMVCDYLNSSPGNGVPSNDLAVFSYNPAAHTYARLGIFKDTKPFAEQVTVRGNTWVTSADIPHKGATLLYRNVHVFSQDDKQARATTEISADKGKTWVTISRFTATSN